MSVADVRNLGPVVSTVICFRMRSCPPPPSSSTASPGSPRSTSPSGANLYRWLSERDGWATRDEAAEALGVARSVAAFHLDKLADAGVVDVTLPAHDRPHRARRRSALQALPAPRRRGVRLGPRTPLRPGGVPAGRGRRRGEPDRRTDRRLPQRHGADRRPPRRPGGRDDAGGSPDRDDDPRQTVLDVLAQHGYEPELGDRRPGHPCQLPVPPARPAAPQRWSAG